MTDYKLPRAARQALSHVVELDSRARTVERRVEEHLEHLRQANEERDAGSSELLDRKEKAFTKKRDASAARLDRREKAVARAEREFEKRRETAERELAEREEAFRLLTSDTAAGFTLIADAWADYEKARTAQASLELRKKDRPAPHAAEAVRAKGVELAEAVRRAKAAEWIVELYEWQLPWITELREAAELESFVKRDPADETKRDEDPAARWLSAEEYKSLSTAERNQRSLDRYLKSQRPLGSLAGTTSGTSAI